MKMMKKSFSALLIVAMLCSVIPIMSFKASAESGIQEKLNNILRVYPSGSYFTSTGSAHHTDKDSTVCPAVCSICNIKNIPARGGLPSGASTGYDGYQCWAFASYVGHIIFGSHFSSWGKTSLANAKLGDVIEFWMGSWYHYGIYLYTSGSNVVVYDANSDMYCKVVYGSSYSSSNVTNVYHASNYDSINGISPHTHNMNGGFAFKEAAHPHCNCYYCSVCGEVQKSGETNFIDTCEECLNTVRPSQPNFTNWKNNYNSGETITFTWDTTTNTTHYNMWIKKYVAGEWQTYEPQLQKISSGLQRTLSDGTYMIELQAYNSNYWESDKSDWLHSVKNYYFTVGNNTPVATAALNNNTYELYQMNLSWTEAKQWCENNGGHLVTITSQAEQDTVLSLFSGIDLTYAWIGYFDQETEGTFEWVTNEKSEFSEPWNSGEPNDYRAGEDYAAIYNTGYWNDLPDAGSITVPLKGFVLEKEKSFVQVSFDPNGGQFDGEQPAYSVLKGASFTIPNSIPQKQNYQFLGWSANPNVDSPEYHGGDVIDLTENITLYAVYELLPNQNVPQIILENKDVMRGKEVSMDLNLKGNPGFSVINVGFLYDKNHITLQSIENKVSTFSMVSDKSVVWDSVDNYSLDGTLATLHFTVDENAPIGNYTIVVVFMGASNDNFEEVQMQAISGTLTVRSTVYGDANGDGAVNSIDLAMLRKYLASKDPATGEYSMQVQAGADVGGDGNINSIDLAMLRKYLASKDPETGEYSFVLGPR